MPCNKTTHLAEQSEIKSTKSLHLSQLLLHLPVTNKSCDENHKTSRNETIAKYFKRHHLKELDEGDAGNDERQKSPDICKQCPLIRKLIPADSQNICSGEIGSH